MSRPSRPAPDAPVRIASRPAARLATAAGAALLAACASGAGPMVATPPQQPMPVRIETTAGVYETRLISSDHVELADVPATPEAAWRALPAVFVALRVEPNTLSEPQRTYGVTQLRVRGRLAGEPLSRFLSCGTGPVGQENADAYEVTLTALTRVTPGVTASSSSVGTLVTASARAMGTSGSAVSCSSTGRLEERIAKLVALEAAKAAASQ